MKQAGLPNLVLCLVVLATVSVNGSAIPSKTSSCHTREFSCECKLRAEGATKNIVKINVLRCVTKANNSTDVICKSADVVTKCQKLLAKQPVIETLGLKGSKVVYIGGQATLTCKMSKTEAATFIKSGVQIEEHGRFLYEFQNSGRNQLLMNLQITNITKQDEGNYTCFAIRFGLKSTQSYTLHTVPCPAGHFCPLFSNKALPCKPGTYRTQFSRPTHKCIPHLRGKGKTGAKSRTDFPQGSN